MAELFRTQGHVPSTRGHLMVDVVGRRVAGGVGITAIAAAVAWFDWDVRPESSPEKPVLRP